VELQLASVETVQPPVAPDDYRRGGGGAVYAAGDRPVGAAHPNRDHRTGDGLRDRAVPVPLVQASHKRATREEDGGKQRALEF
jgi:hypothetical protein